MERVREAEQSVMNIVKRYGKLIIIGDQLTVQSIENAMESRKNDSTDFEKFQYISAVRLGDFHLEMNVIIQNIQRLMPSESSVNRGSLGYFAHYIVISHLVSNKAHKIKKVGHYQKSKEFFVTVGREFLHESLKTWLSDKVEEVKRIV